MFSPAGPKRVLIHEPSNSRANTSELGSKCDIKQLLKKKCCQFKNSTTGKRKTKANGSENDTHIRVLNKHRINYPCQNTFFTSCVKLEIRILMLFENEWISDACKKERLLLILAKSRERINSSGFKKLKKLKNINYDTIK